MAAADDVRRLGRVAVEGEAGADDLLPEAGLADAAPPANSG